MTRSLRGTVLRLAAAALLLSAAAAPGAVRAQDDPAPSRTVLPSDADWTRDEAGRARLFDRIVLRLREVYFAPGNIDWTAWAARYRDDVIDAASRPALDAALRRAFDGLEDGHSRWIGRSAAGAAPHAAPADRAPVDLGVDALPLDGDGFLLLRVHPGGAADAAGLQRGDLVVRAGEASLLEPGLGWTMQSRIAAELRQGSADLTVVRAGTGRFDVAVEARDLPAGARSRPVLSVDPASGVARLDVPDFGPGSADSVHAAVTEARTAGATGLVLDLRGNPGGSVVQMGLVAAIATDGVLLASWRADGPDWRLEVTRDGDVATARLVRATGPLAGSDLASGRLEARATWDGPLAVLVDERSASAAEATAALLAGQAGATLVGVVPPGNVESVRRVAFPGGNEAWVAVGDLRTPDGEAIVPLAVDVPARLDPRALARGHDAPFAEAVRLLRALPVTPGRWF